MLIKQIKTKGILEVIHHVLDVSLGDPSKNLVIGLRILGALKVAAKEIFWSRCILKGESLYSDRVKYTVRVLVKKNQVIAIEFHI